MSIYEYVEQTSEKTEEEENQKNQSTVPEEQVKTSNSGTYETYEDKSLANKGVN